MITRICTPYYSEFDSVKEGLKTLEGDTRLEALQIRGSVISELRNFLVQKNLKSSLKKQEIVDRDFLFIDSDISFDKKHVDRVIALGEFFPIVFLPYVGHDNKDFYQCGTWGPVIGAIGSKFPTTTELVRKVDWCGAGFLYIKREVFEAIDFPYFRFSVLDLGDNAAQIGEDIGFCMQVHNKFPIFCDFSYPVVHNKRS